MSLILSWALFPLVMAVVGLGWGLIAERVAGVRVTDALVLPLGLAAVLVVSGTLTAFEVAAPVATPCVAVGAVIALPLVWAQRQRFGGWPLLVAVATLLAYGAPVLLSGQATFAGFIKLDDTATWFSVIDHVMSHSRSVSGEPASTYALEFNTDIGATYPLGSFVVLGAVRPLVGVDVAWLFQPYLACCGAAVALCLYALSQPLVQSVRIRALVAFLAAQSALLYGYSLWGGIKELTAAFLLVLMVTLAAAISTTRPTRARELIPVAIAAGALIQTLGVGAVAWVGLAFVLLAGLWLLRGSHTKQLRESAVSIMWLGLITAMFIIPVWVVLGGFLSNHAGLFSSGQSLATRFGNLGHELSAFQLVGIWPVGDFRQTPQELPRVLLIGLALLAATYALWTSARRRENGLLLYVAVALGGCAAIYLAGATPWVVAKTLAIAAPALLAAALLGAVVLGRRRHRVGVVVFMVLALGVLWSNVLAYHDVVLAPRPRLAELQRIGPLVAGKGPTLLNEYEIYADRHFLRAGDPTEPAEYRPELLTLRNGVFLTKPAWSDLDSFPLSTLEAYRSIVTRRSPAESRPPSNYELVWRGRYYDLWQRPAHPSTSVLVHVSYGESNSMPYCGTAENGPSKPECSADPVAIPSCARIRSFSRLASRRHGSVVAFLRPAPIVARGDQTLWPAPWLHDLASHTLTPTTPGVAVSHIAVANSQRYALWLGGSFARGFEVSVDGQPIGRVKDELSAFGGYVQVAAPFLTAGVHTFALTYPGADLTPGSGNNSFTSLSAIALQPQRPATRLITLAPQHAGLLCGQSLDWLEVVAESG